MLCAAGIRHCCDTDDVRPSFTKFEFVAMRLLVTLGLTVTMFIATIATPERAGSTTTTSTSPVSASFLPSGEGWILTAYHCPTGVCIAVKRTVNDGQSWTSLPLPSRLRTIASPSTASYFPLVQQNIYFADPKDGWIFGTAPADNAAQTNVSYIAE